MSFDASWSSRRPGLVPPALVRAAVEALRQRGEQVQIDEDEEPPDLEGLGGSAVIEVGELGPIHFFQPDSLEEAAHLGLSTSSGASRDDWDELVSVGDALATQLGFVFDGVEALETFNESRRTSGSARVVSVRVEIKLEPTRKASAERPKPRVISLRGNPLATLTREQMAELEPEMKRAVAGALSLPDNQPGLAEVTAWLSDMYAIVEREENLVRLRTRPEENAPIFTVMVEGERVQFFAWPDVDLELREALEKNESTFIVAALGIDDEDDWTMRAALPTIGLRSEALMEFALCFTGDLETLVGIV